MIVTRFAPSPTGYLHLGHAAAALVAHDAAWEAGGLFLLRIEDIDRARCRQAFDAAILEDLVWLGLTWNGDVRRQSAHMNDYRATAATAPHGAAHGSYPGTCRALSTATRAEKIAAGESYAIRLDVRGALTRTGPLFWRDRSRGLITATPEWEGDPVVARRDAPTSYHLSVTVDDHSQGVTLVTRGEDLFAATHIHRLLQALLGYATPDYHHHRVLTDATGARLSKRDGALSLRALREVGRTPEEVLDMARR
jgi:glutamyl-Q tRNA(Asp) synthetase